MASSRTHAAALLLIVAWAGEAAAPGNNTCRAARPEFSFGRTVRGVTPSTRSVRARSQSHRRFAPCIPSIRSHILEEAFAEGIVTGHPTMPEFRLDPGQIADVIAYFKTLEQ